MRLVRCVLAGAVAGAIGTAAMDAVWYSRYRKGGGTDSWFAWESGEAIKTWDDASAPGQLAHKALAAAGQSSPPDEWARPATNVVHWATGIGWGVQFGLAVAAKPQHRRLLGAALGPVAWLASYVILPLAKVYKPIWEYDRATLRKDLSAHLVFGNAASAAFNALS